jgi:aspartate-semialdehyde dehydrogenase
MKVAIIGATGLVGTVMLKVLEERNFFISELILVASERSVGKQITFAGVAHTVVSAETAIAARPQFAIFSAGGSTSLALAPKFAAVGTTVIDNSSAWRMHPDIKLIVPEVNGTTLTAHDKIIANPNCSTIQMVLALHPIHQKYGIKRVVVSTYQSVTGTGVKAVQQLENERKGIYNGEMAYKYRIDMNAIPQIDVFLENGYTKEEMKLTNETQKIMGDSSIMVTATTVRIPVMGGHSEAVNIELNTPYELADVRQILENTQGITVKDNPDQQQYPMPLLDAQGSDQVFVGRIRRDTTIANGLNMWIVADNLRKGAATNAVQIAEYLVQNKIIS